MRIVSVNAWGGHEWPALSSWVKTVGADVLCLQEVTRAPVPGPEWLYYRDPYRDLQQRADLFDDVSRLLPEHQGRFAAATRGTLEDDEGGTVTSEHGLGQWVRRDLALAEHQQNFIHGSYRFGGWGEEPVPRAIQISRVVDPDTGADVVVAHLHGLREPAGKEDTAARHAQADRICALLGEAVRPGDAVVLAGDFNLLPDSATFEALRGIGLRDLVTGGGHTDTRTSLYFKPQRYADYMLVSDAVRVRSFDVPATPEVSDHRAMILDIVTGG